MAKAAILTVDDDPQVLSAIDRDLKAKYQAEYRIVRASSGEEALEALGKLQERRETTALILADQRMRGISGVELLTKSRKIAPDARRVLLTAYSETDAAIRAINEAHLDYYLTKPWDPPAERLYPVLDDLLETWKCEFVPDFDGIKVIGHRWSSASHNVKDLLARNQVPYRWLDLEQSAEARGYVEKMADIPCFPLVIFPNGQTLQAPSESELAAKAGLRTRAAQPFYDLVIIGGGPTGLAAAVYGASEGLSTLMIEQYAPGGQAGTTSKIENYLGFPTGVTGSELAQKAVFQAKRFGVEILAPQTAMSMRVDGDYRHIVLRDGAEVAAHVVLIATGVSYRKLDVPGAEKLEGCGIYYGAALTEALSCKGEEIFVVGGANSAGQGALYLAQYAGAVHMVVRADSLNRGMSKYLVDQIRQEPNIKVYTDTCITKIDGDDCVQSVDIHNKVTAESTTCPSTAVFVFIGAEPHTDWLGGAVWRDERGFLMTGPDLVGSDDSRPGGWPLKRDPFLLETNVPGVFAAGDVRHGAIRRVAAGVGTGSMAVQFIHQYLADLK